MGDMKNSTTCFNRLKKTYSSRGESSMYPAKDCTAMAVAAHSGLRAANLTHPARQGVYPQRCRQGAISSRQPRGVSLMYPAKDCTTMVAAAHLGMGAANLTHPVCEEDEEEDEEEEEEDDEEEEEIVMSIIILQKMHPSRGGSLMHPEKGQERIKQVTPTIIIDTGSCAVSTIDPACQEEEEDEEEEEEDLCESIAVSLRPGNTEGFNSLPRQPFQGCASFTEDEEEEEEIVTSIIILQKMHPSRGGSLMHPEKGQERIKQVTPTIIIDTGS